MATPANWTPGQDTVVLPFISDEEAERMFGAEGGVRKVRSYLRYVRDPSLRSLLVSQTHGATGYEKEPVRPKAAAPASPPAANPRTD